VQGGLAVAVAEGRAELERRGGQLDRAVELASGAVGEREVVEGGDACARVGGGLREGEAAVEVPERGGGVAGAGGEGAEQVVSLAEGAGVAGLLGEVACAFGELSRARRLVVIVGGEAEIGRDARTHGEVGLGGSGRRGLEVRGRERALAAAVVDLADAVLDPGQLLRRAVRGRGLVAGERVGVVASQRVQVADRGVQRAGVGMPEGEGRAQVLERLGVGEQRAGVGGGAGVGLGRLGVAAREAQVAGVRCRRPDERVGRAAVQQPAAREARLLVDERTQPLVAEVVVEAALADEPAPDELLERADRLLLAATAGRAHRPGVERAPDHGRRGEHLAGDLADGVDAGEEQLARTGG
jgi:hypothetical protein